MLQHLLDLLFPRALTYEQRYRYWISPDEWNAIPFKPYKEGEQELTKRGLGSLNSIVSALRYDDSTVLRKAIHLCKYHKLPGLAYRLSHLIVRAGLPHVQYGMVLTPVPLHFARAVQRGFNQSELLAKHVSSSMDLPLQKLLWRTQSTGHQAWRSRYERMESMKTAFRVCPFASIPSHVVLIDDIATTGATLDACAATLKRAGVKRIDAWVIARA